MLGLNKHSNHQVQIHFRCEIQVLIFRYHILNSELMFALSVSYFHWPRPLISGNPAENESVHLNKLEEDH